MGAIEQKYCRAPLARSFNAMSNVRWIPNFNISFSEKFGKADSFNADYESGRPDAFVFNRGRVICVECKAAFEKFNIDQWKSNQVKWHRENSAIAGVPYYLAIWLSEVPAPQCGRDTLESLFMIPFDAMMNADYEETRNLSYRKMLAIFGQYALKIDRGLYKLPVTLWNKS